MDSAGRIRHAMAQVQRLRDRARGDPAMWHALESVKDFQSRRFRRTYDDLLGREPYAGAVRFFLDELYGSSDFQSRDAQFARIAGALQRLLPGSTLGTAVALAELHELTEELDHALASHWRDLRADEAAALDASSYCAAWRRLDRHRERERQLGLVMQLGDDLARQVRTPGLRLLVRAMHRPAHAAGLGSIQRFLERGLDAFLALEREDRRAVRFLNTIRARESALIKALSDGKTETCLQLLVR